MLVIAGLQTDYCIDASVKCDFEHGFHVIVPSDANTTIDNSFMTGENSYKYYNELIWKDRYAECITAEKVIERMEESIMSTMKLGDVIIFEAGDSWISKGIAKLTNSTVSHAAIKYTADCMVEMGKKGITTSGCHISKNGEKAYLLRLKPERDPEPLIKAAEKYLSEGVLYDYPDLILFAGLLIYRAVRPTPRWQKVTDLVLNLACAELDKMLNMLLHKGEKVPAMVCSQLVYQCYLDCGSDYEIILENGLLQSSGAGVIRLADLLDDLEDCAMPSEEVAVNCDLEELARELCLTLDEAESDHCVCLEAKDMHQTIGWAKKFLDIAERILEESGVDIPVPALFVAPCDLLNHAVNLVRYGTECISRD